MCKGSSGPTTTTTGTSAQTSAPNPVALAAYQDVLGRAQGVASSPYQPYGGQLVAGLTPEQLLAQTGINAAGQNTGGIYNTALGYAGQGATPISSADIARYYDPYQRDVINATQAQFDVENARQQQQVIGNAALQGALGGNRVGVAQALTAENQQRAQAPVIAGLESRGYTQALQTAAEERAREAMAANQFAQFGSNWQNANLQAAQAQLGMGTLEQQTQQAQLNAAYQQYLQAQAFPYQQTQWLAGIASGVAPGMGGTQYGTQYGQQIAPPPNYLGQIAGLGLAAAPFFMAKRGGRIPHRQGGGFAGVPFAGASGFIPGMELRPAQGPQFAQMPGLNFGSGQGGQDPLMDYAKLSERGMKTLDWLDDKADAKAGKSVSDMFSPGTTFGGAGDAYWVNPDTGSWRGGTAGVGTGAFVPHLAGGGDDGIYDDENERGGEAAGIGLAEGQYAPATVTEPQTVLSPLAAQRGVIMDRIRSDPALKERLFRNLAMEGGDPLKQLEVEGNRWTARGIDPMTDLTNRYRNPATGKLEREWPQATVRGATPGVGQRTAFEEYLDQFRSGSNAANYGTSNASANVGFGYGRGARDPITAYDPDSRERYGLQNDQRDFAWAKATSGQEGVGGYSPPEMQRMPVGASTENLTPEAKAALEEADTEASDRRIGIGDKSYLRRVMSSPLFQLGVGMMASPTNQPGIGGLLTTVGQGAVKGIAGMNEQQRMSLALKKMGETENYHKERMTMLQNAADDRADIAAARLAEQKEKREAGNWVPFIDERGRPQWFYNKNNPRDIISVDEMNELAKKRGTTPPAATTPPTTTTPPATTTPPTTTSPPPATSAEPSAAAPAVTAEVEPPRDPRIILAAMQEQEEKGLPETGQFVEKPNPKAEAVFKEMREKGDSEDDVNMVRAIGEGRKKALPQSGRGNANNKYLMGRVQTAYPDWDENFYGQRGRARNFFAVGTANGGGQAINNMNTFAHHVAGYLQLVKKYDLGGLTDWNDIKNKLAEKGFRGAEAQDILKALRIKAATVAGEGAKIFAGTNSALADREHWAKELPVNIPFHTGLSAAKALVEQIEGRLNGLATQYNQGMGTNHPDNYFISKETRRIFKEIKEGRAPEGHFEGRYSPGQIQEFDGKQYRFRGGDEQDKKNWVPLKPPAGEAI